MPNAPTQPEAVLRARRWLEQERPDDGIRDREIEKLAAAYDGYIWDLEGGKWQTGGRTGPSGTVATLKDAARTKGDEDSFRYSEVSVNLIRPQTEDWKAVLAVLPTISVPPRKRGDRMAQQKADLREAIIQSVWSDSNMVIQFVEDTHYRTLYGSTAVYVMPEPSQKRVRIRVRPPYRCHSRYKMDGSLLHHLAWDMDEETEMLAEMYPGIKRFLKGERVAGRVRFPTTMRVTEWNDENNRIFLIDDTWYPDLPLIEHNWGFVPGTVIPNVLGTGSIWARSDAQQVIHLSQMISELMSMSYDAVFQKVYDEVVAFSEKPISQLSAGPFELTQIHDTGGRLELMHSGMALPDIQSSLGNLERYGRLVGGWPEVLSGEMDSSYISGKAFSAAQGPVAARAAIRHKISAVHYQKINVFALLLYDMLFPTSEIAMWNMDLSLADSAFPNAAKKAAKELNFVPSRDIAGQYENVLQFLPAGTDRYRQTVEWLQWLEAEVISLDWMRDQIPGLDTVAIDQQIRQRLMEKAELQARAQGILQKQQMEMQMQMMAAQAGAQPPGAPSGAGGAAGAQQPQPPTQVGGQERITLAQGPGARQREALGPGAQGPGPAPRPRNRVTLAEAKQAFSRVRRILGEVFLGGAIVATGYTDGQIEVWVTVPDDKGTLINGTVYGAQKRLLFHPLKEGEVPDEAVVNVTPPREVTEQEQQRQQQQQPEGVMA